MQHYTRLIAQELEKLGVPRKIEVATDFESADIVQLSKGYYIQAGNAYAYFYEVGPNGQHHTMVSRVENTGDVKQFVRKAVSHVLYNKLK